MTIKNPYVGPRTFSEAQADRFFGREREARDLRAMVMAERLVLFYAQSGAGKSSLINTRLIPQLRDEEGFEVLPVGRVSGDLPAGIAAHDVKNIYSFNLNLSLSQSDTALAPAELRRLARLTLADFLAGGEEDGPPDPPEGETGDSPPDPPEGGETGEIPPFGGLGGAMEIEDDEEYVYEDVPYLLIIDQFEEIVTTHPARWPERAAFFEQLRQAMEQHPNLWLVLVMREDFVASLDPYLQWLPNRLRARYYMQRMGVKAARQAIQKPAAAAGRDFTPEAATQLVDNLRQIRSQSVNLQHGPVLETGPLSPQQTLGQYVEPVQLQVVCYQLWENLHPNLPTSPSPNLPPITITDLGQYGDVDTALADFYEQALRKTLAETGLPETTLRRWFDEELITEADTRGTVYQGEETTAGLPNAAVDHLAAQFLLRAEPRAGGIWIELIHDRFVDPIRQANQRWETQRLQLNPLMRPTEMWHDADQSPELLLDGGPLREAERYAAQHPQEITDDERLFLEESLRRETQLAKTKRLAERRRRVTTVVALGVIAVLLALTTWAFQQQTEAKNQAEIASSNAATATFALNDAKQQAEIAAKNAATAEAAQVTAVAAQADAEANAATATFALNDAKQQAEIAAKNAATAEAAQVTAVAAQNDAEANAAAAEFQSRIALAQSLAAVAPHNNNDSELSTLLAIEAQNVNQTVPGNAPLWLIHSTLQDILQQSYFSTKLNGHEDRVLSVAFSPDGQRLASSSADQTVRLWDLINPEAAPVVLSDGHEDRVWSVAFSPDGQQLASVSDDQTVRLWDLTDPEAAPVVLRGHEDSVLSVAFSPDGQQLASGSADRTVRLWDLTAPETAPVVLPDGHENWVRSVAFSPDGQQLASGSADQTVRLWNLTDPEAAPDILYGHESRVRSVAFSPDGQRLVSASDDRTVRLWDLTDPEAAPDVLRGHEDWVRSVAFSPDGQRLASASDDQTVRLWDLTDPEAAPVVLRGHEDWVRSVAFSPDGQRLASGSADQTVRLWNLINPEAAPVVLFDGHEDRVWSVAFSPDGQQLASGSADQTVRLWDLTDPEAAPVVLRGHEDRVWSVAFSPDGQQLASGSDDQTVRLWNLTDPEAAPVVLRGHEDSVLSVAFSPDGQQLASGSADQTVRLWDLTDPEAAPAVLPDGHEDRVWSVAFSPDGQQLASGSDDQTMRLWSLIDPKVEPIILRGPESKVQSVAFSPDGQRLAGGSTDKAVRLWDLTDPEVEPVVLRGHESLVLSVAFSPDGQQLASTSDDRTIRLWLVQIDTLIEIGCRRVHRNLSWEEWQRYMPPDVMYRKTCENLPIHPSVFEATGG